MGLDITTKTGRLLDIGSNITTFTKFILMADFHSNQSKITEQKCPAIDKALRKYNAENGCLPERVIMYR